MTPSNAAEKQSEKDSLAGARILPAVIDDEMKSSYLGYAMSVIIGRALPDVRDGLKPVHRRILFAMNDMGITYKSATKKSARIVGECFVKDTLVLTSKGLVPIQDVKKGDLVYTQKGKKKVSELFIMPKKELLKIRLSTGIENVATKSQKFKVLNGNWQYDWKEAKDLGPHDWIVTKAVYPEIKNVIKIGDKALNNDVAYFLGQMMSDGYLEHQVSIGRSGKKNVWQRIGFSTCSEQIIGKIHRVMEHEFNYSPSIETRIYEHETVGGQLLLNEIHTVRINSKRINSFLIQQFSLKGLKASTKTIPQQIMQSPREVIFSFISGLIDGDGSIHVDRNLIHYGTVSETLANKLLVVLQHMGIFGKKYYSEPKDSVINGRDIIVNYKLINLEFSGINAHKLAAELMLFEERKSERIKNMLSKRISKSDHDTLPYASQKLFSGLSKHHLGRGWFKDNEGNKFKTGIKHPSGAKIIYERNLQNKPLRISQIKDFRLKEKLKKIRSATYPFIDEIENHSISFSRVEIVEQTPEEATYDIQVEEDHEFVANGMIAHNCLGKYHPHGDTSVYDALVRMAQDFSMRYPLIHGQGNMGSLDGDSAAAMRYTEAKLAKISDEIMLDIDKETVNFVDNFDGSLKEPTVLPAKIPNLLINGSSGIAVGMATNIPPHNLSEICAAVIRIIDEPEIGVRDLLATVKGPDFPTGAIIVGKQGIVDAYTTGRGSIEVKAKVDLEEKKDRHSLIISEIPYQLNKSLLIEQMADAVNNKAVQGISDIRDESDRAGMRIVLELKKGANAEIVKNQLFKYTRLHTSFGAIMIALVDNQPKTLNLREILNHFLHHRQAVVRKRTNFDLRKAQERSHILEGLLVALSHLDPIIALIKASKDPGVAKKSLCEKYKLTELQSQAILDLRLQRLTSLEQQKIKEEHKELLLIIKKLNDILADEGKILRIIKDEMADLTARYGNSRKTMIEESDGEELDMEDLVKPEENIITVSRAGYIKRQALDAYKTQNRGGKGIIGASIKDEDVMEHIFIANTHDYILVFTDQGKLYWLKAYNIPEAARQSKGKPIINLIRTERDEKVQALIPVKAFSSGSYLVFATKKGLIKKTSLGEYSNVRQGGIIAISLTEGDEVIEVALTDGNQNILIATAAGSAVKFSEGDVRPVGRAGQGVRGIRLSAKDEVIGMIIAKDDESVLTITENGFGKRSSLGEYRFISRGGKGVRNIICSERNGQVVSVKRVVDSDEIMLVSQEGIIIRVPVSSISVIGRNTQGVRIMKLGVSDKVVAVAKV